MAIDTPNENDYRDSLDSFTDRERILAHIDRYLHTSQAGTFQLLAIKGHSGTGKTFLIEYLSKRICPPAGWQTGVLAFTQSYPDFRSILDGIEDALKRCVPVQSLTPYRTQREEYKRRFDEYRANITVHQDVGAKDASSVANIQMSAQVNAELRRRELQLRAELTRALLELAEASTHPLCLFIDSYERLAETDPELVGWLWEEVLLKLPTHAPYPILIVTCGWEHPMSAALQPFSTRAELDDFDLHHVQSYLQAQGNLPCAVPTQEALASAFYDFSKGHPLVLALAVTYFQTLPEAERTVENLQARRPLLDEEARVQWLEERLLRRLPEPYRTLLERGPILRSINQAALQVLLQAEPNENNAEIVLDDRSYIRFLQYPFINRKNAQGDALLEQPTFHVLTRRVRLEGLRHWHPETRQRLHRAMAEYYMKIMDTEQQRVSMLEAKQPVKEFAEWFAEIPQQEFRALLEYLYHALQVTEMQVEAFEQWRGLVGRVVERWRRKQAGPLLEMVRQVVEDGEPFLGKDSDSYGQYLLWYSRFLEQDALWDDALVVLQEAGQVFERVKNFSKQAACLNNIGTIYDDRGQLDSTLDYYQRSLSLYEQVDNPSDIALSLNNIGEVYRERGQLDLALDYHQRSLSLREQVGNPSDIALSLNNIGELHRQQGQLDLALDYHQRSLSLYEQVGNPSDIARSLNNIGMIYDSQGQLDVALDYNQRSLSLREQVGNPSDIALSLNNIGGLHRQQGQLDLALDYHQRSLSLYEQVGNPSDIARSLNNIGMIYNSQGQRDLALDYYQRSLSLYEQVGNPSGIAASLNNIGEVYRQQGQLDLALDYFHRSLSLYEQVGNPSDIALSLNNIGAVYNSQGQRDLALDYYQRSLSLYEQVGNPSDIALSLNNIGMIYQPRGQLDLALDYFHRSLSLYEQVGNPSDIALSLHNIGYTYYSQDKWQDALPLFSRSLSLYEQMGRGFESVVADELEMIAACYVKLGEIEKGVPYYVRAQKIREQLKGE